MYYHPILGGQETYISNLNSICEKNGIITFVLQPEKLDADKPENVFFTRYIPYSHFLKKISKHWEWYIFSLSLLFYRKKLREFDVLICHYPFHFPFIKWHKRIIVVSHGVLWSNKLSNRSIFDMLHILFSKKLRKSKNVTIVANDTDFLKQIGIEAQTSKNYFEQTGSNSWFIPNCVDRHQFMQLTAVKKEKIILIPRNIRPDRGIDLAIRAFSILPERYQDYKLLIVGLPSDKEYFEKCKSLVNQLNLTERIFFSGSVEWGKMVEIYNKATITVIPTIEKEGTSLSALESMACNTPVVSTRAGGLADLPTYKSNMTPDDLQKGITTVLQDMNYYSKSQSELVNSVFNIENWANAWINVIKMTTKE